MKFVKKMQKWQNVEQNVKCVHFSINACSNANLIINFFAFFHFLTILLEVWVLFVYPYYYIIGYNVQCEYGLILGAYDFLGVVWHSEAVYDFLGAHRDHYTNFRGSM